MNLVRKSGDIGGYVFFYTCLACLTERASTWPYWADLDGPAYQAYYCDHCGSAAKIRHDRTKGAV